MLAYLSAIRRYWWIVPISVLAAVATAVLMIYRVELGAPPKFVARDQASYQATTELLIDSPARPYLRGVTAELIPVRTPQPPQQPGTRTTDETNTVVEAVPVEKSSLVDAANLFPLLIVSDEITQRRIAKLGGVRGFVGAKALFAFQGNNRFRPSILPVVQVQATSPTPAEALRLADGTVTAFTEWLGEQQGKAKIAAQERVVVKQLRGPSGVERIGGPSYELPVLAGGAVLFMFLFFAVFLDRLRTVPRPTSSIPVAYTFATNGNGFVELEGSLEEMVERISREVEAITAQTAPMELPEQSQTHREG